MKNKTPLFWVGLSLVTFLCSCSNITGNARYIEEFIKVSDDVYKLHQVSPWIDRYSAFRDLQMEKAHDFCERQGKGMMPIDAISNPNGKGGYEGEILFRCVRELPNPNKGLFG